MGDEHFIEFLEQAGKTHKAFIRSEKLLTETQESARQTAREKTALLPL